MISVVIPLYNAEKYIIDSIESVVNQEMQLELIVVDDCSKDNSVDCVLKYLREELNRNSIADTTEIDINNGYDYKEFEQRLFVNRLKLIFRQQIGNLNVIILQNEENMGVAHTRNIGVLMASGDYIAFLDADDMWHKDKLKKQLEHISNKDFSLVCTEREMYTADGEATGRIISSPEEIDISILKKSNYINCSSVLIKRNVMLEYPMEHSEVHEDYLTWLRIVKNYGKAYCIKQPLLLYRLSESGKSRNKLKAAKMTYKTYVLAGFGRIKALFMMVPYMINGIKKY